MSGSLLLPRFLSLISIALCSAVFAAPTAPTLSTPADAAKNVLTTATLTWAAVSGASSYQLQVSTSRDFTSTVFDQSGLTGTSQAVSSGLNASSIAIGTPVNYGNQGGFYNDNPRTIIRKGSTTTFRSFEGFNDVIYEGTLTNPVANGMGNYSWSWGGDNTHELSWIMAAYNPGGDTLIGYVHTEDQGQSRYTVGLALSTNFGSAWTYIGDVARHDVTSNLGGGMMIMMNGYIYMYYNGGGLSVCRSPIDSVMIAARQKTVTKWMTYSNGAWTLPALTSSGTRTFPGDAHGGATVVKSTGTVLGLPNGGVNTSTTPIHASVDGLTTYQTYNIPAPGSVYGSFAGSAESGARTDHFEVGNEFYLYWDHKEGGNYNDDHFYYAKATVAPMNYYWRVRATDASGAGAWSTARIFTTRATIQGGTVGVENAPSRSSLLPESTAKLMRDVDGQVKLTYTMPTPSTVKIGMYDMRGRLVKTMVSSDLAAGVNTAMIDASALNAGRYLVRIRAAGMDKTVPVTLSK